MRRRQDSTDAENLIRDYIQDSPDYQVAQGTFIQLAQQELLASSMQDDTVIKKMNPAYLCIYLLERIEIKNKTKNKIFIQYVQDSMDYVLTNVTNIDLLTQFAKDIFSKNDCYGQVDICNTFLFNLELCYIGDEHTDLVLVNYIASIKKRMVSISLDSAQLRELTSELKMILTSLRSYEPMMLRGYVDTWLKKANTLLSTGNKKKISAIVSALATIPLEDRCTMITSTQPNKLQEVLKKKTPKLYATLLEQLQPLAQKTVPATPPISIVNTHKYASSSSFFNTTPTSSPTEHIDPIQQLSLDLLASPTPLSPPPSPTESAYLSSDDQETSYTQSPLMLFSLEQPIAEENNTPQMSHS